MYVYRTIRIERGAWPRVASASSGVYGLWRGEIGWYSDEGALMSTRAVAEEIDGVIDWTERRLEATVRPTDDVPPTEDGVYAHRWFEVAEADFDEFLDLSEGAWPDFESTYGAKVVGLWRDVEAPEHALLITRYPSLAVWESSRPYKPGPRRSGAEAPKSAEESRKRFVRRAEITKRTGVRIARLVPGVSATAV